MKIKILAIVISAFALIGGMLLVLSRPSAIPFVTVKGEEVNSMHNEEISNENLLAPYQVIMDKFNEQYNTEFEFQNDEVLKNEGSNKEEQVSFFTSMSEEEFWDYLYDAYLSEQSSDLQDLNGKTITAE